MMGKCNEHTYCGILNDLVQDYHNKGIVDITVISVDDGSTKHIGIAYKDSKKSRGIMLNYCPFCGEKILKEVTK